MSPRRQREPEGGVATTREARAKPPARYKVLLHNDDYTTQDFVTGVLESIFRHPPDTAFRLMLEVHTKGVAVAGVYPREIAEAKAERVVQLARAAELPFLATVEAE
ncbi:MAG: ATP-dependent Clp protease adaptor ClpS [Deltaproteobacteria bacterium]